MQITHAGWKHQLLKCFGEDGVSYARKTISESRIGTLCATGCVKAEGLLVPVAWSLDYMAMPRTLQPLGCTRIANRKDLWVSCKAIDFSGKRPESQVSCNDATGDVNSFKYLTHQAKTRFYVSFSNPCYFGKRICSYEVVETLVITWRDAQLPIKDVEIRFRLSASLPPLVFVRDAENLFLSLHGCQKQSV